MIVHCYNKHEYDVTEWLENGYHMPAETGVQYLLMPRSFRNVLWVQYYVTMYIIKTFTLLCKVETFANTSNSSDKKSFVISGHGCLRQKGQKQPLPVLCKIGYPSESHLKLKSREIWDGYPILQKARGRLPFYFVLIDVMPHRLADTKMWPWSQYYCIR